MGANTRRDWTCLPNAWVRVVRLMLACPLALAVTLVWYDYSFHVVASHYGEEPDGPGCLMVAPLLLAPVTGVVLLGLFLGLPYLMFLCASDRLGFRCIMLPTLLAGLACGLLTYVSLHSWGGPVAPIMGAMFALGVLASGLCFYTVGVLGSWSPRQAGERAAAENDGLK
jgi:hypothetical protein